MSVAGHQEKDEKTGKRKAGVERRQADFKEAARQKIVQGAARQKIVCVRGVPGVTGTLGKANSHFDPIQTGWGPHHHVKAAIDWGSSLSKKIGVNTCFGDGQEVRNDD